MFSVLDLAERVQRVALERGISAVIEHRENPRVEREAHYYNAKNTSLLALGLQPHLLDDATIGSMLDLAAKHRDRIDMKLIAPNVQWAPGAARARKAASSHAPSPIVPPGLALKR
jgi:UDP-sulfoquinovose synthase